MVNDTDSIWKALADPVRREVLDMLRDGPQTTGSLADRFDQTRFGVMKHLDVLETAGLISIERRGRERWNFLNAAKLKQSTDRWLSPFQTLWADRLSNLTHHFLQENDMTTIASPLGLDIRQEISLPAPKVRVFEALTKDINAWWGDKARQAGVGSTIRLTPEIGADMIETRDGQHAVIWARVEEVRAPDLLFLAGRFAVNGALAGRIQFELADEGEGTKLTLTHQAIGHIPEEMQAHFSNGWNELIDANLRHYLDDATQAK